MSLKKTIKNIIQTIGLLPLAYWFLKVGRKIRRFMKAFLFYLYNGFFTNFPSYKFRTFYLRHILKIEIGKHTSIHMGCFFSGNKISIGDNTVVARKCYLDGRTGFIRIKNNVSIAPETYILSMTHQVNSPIFDTVSKDVTIDDYVWIGARVMILPGVNAGKGSVLGAGAVVTKNVEPYTIVAGSPAKKIGERSKELDYSLSYFPYFNGDIT